MRGGLDDRIRAILDRAREKGRSWLTEPEALEVVEALGIRTPERFVVRDARAPLGAGLESLPGDRVVVKIVSATILHKSDAGGVAIVPKNLDAVAQAIETMAEMTAGREVEGYSINAFVPHDRAFGSELLVGLRRTEDCGPVVVFGSGGVQAETIAEHLRPERGAAILSPALTDREALASILKEKAVFELLTGGRRGRKPLVAAPRVASILGTVLDVAARLVPVEIAEFEINPLIAVDGGLIALDAVLRLGPGAVDEPSRRPTEKIRNLLEPASIAIAGVSDRANPGRVILQNLLRDGFPAENIHVVKPGRETIDGCRCFPSVESIPERVDLFVLSLDAGQASRMLEDIVTGRRAESVILIPGGLGERRGTETLAERIADLLRDSRSTDWRGPVVNGGNCLGIRSRPGRYDTMFIPRHKLASPGAIPSPIAVIAQSGAFAVSRATKLARLSPKYLISIGNQIDLTLGDYLDHLERDPEIEIFATYAEGFRPGDGLKWLSAAAKIVESGRIAILYRAGRTPAGAEATVSHTAAVAGDYAVARELASSAGVVLADSLADFEELIKLFGFLRGKPVLGNRLGAVSNAGFECVAIADNLGDMIPSSLGPATLRRLGGLLSRCHLDGIVDVRNPLDATPIMDDASFEEAVRAVLEDDAVDVGVVGCVPMTGRLQTLPTGAGHDEDVRSKGSVAMRLVRIAHELPKPWVAVVDGGPLYDPMATVLEEGGVPTFRTMDRALRLLGTFCRARLRATQRDANAGDGSTPCLGGNPRRTVR